MPLLPGDMYIIKDMEKQREIQKEKNTLNEPLEVTGQLKNFTPLEVVPNLRKGGADAIDVLKVIQSILDRMWNEFPRNAKNDGYALSPKLLAETAEYRRDLPKVVALTQLYGVFPNAATLVDKAVSRECLKGNVRYIPIQSKDSSSLDLVISAEEFYKLLDPVNPELAALCRSKPDATWFDVQELHSFGIDIPAAIHQGFLLFDPTKSTGSHTIGIPNQGRFLKLERLARTWLIKTIKHGNHKFQELPETTIEDRMVTPKKYWSELRGVSLEWILYDAIGGGWVDGFQTPIGRGWKILSRD